MPSQIIVRRSPLWALLLVACTPTLPDGDESGVLGADTSWAGETGTPGTTGLGFSQEIVCEGEESYDVYVDVGVEPGTMPPRVIRWLHWSEGYRAYQGSLGLPSDVVWGWSEGGSLNDDAHLIISCSYADYTEFGGKDAFRGFTIDWYIVVVE